MCVSVKQTSTGTHKHVALSSDLADRRTTMNSNVLLPFCTCTSAYIYYTHIYIHIYTYVYIWEREGEGDGVNEGKGRASGRGERESERASQELTERKPS